MPIYGLHLCCKSPQLHCISSLNELNFHATPQCSNIAGGCSAIRQHNCGVVWMGLKCVLGKKVYVGSWELERAHTRFTFVHTFVFIGLWCKTLKNNTGPFTECTITFTLQNMQISWKIKNWFFVRGQNVLYNASASGGVGIAHFNMAIRSVACRKCDR